MNIQPASVDFSIRPATTDDIDFIFNLRKETMKPIFEPATGWDEAKERQNASEDLMEAEVVLSKEKKIGIIKVLSKPDGLWLHQLQILPEYQRSGFGSELLKRTIKKAETACRPLWLYVMKNTPAESLYQKFGFILSESFEYNCIMVYKADCLKSKTDSD